MGSGTFGGLEKPAVDSELAYKRSYVTLFIVEGLKISALETGMNPPRRILVVSTRLQVQPNQYSQTLLDTLSFATANVGNNPRPQSNSQLSSNSALT